MNSRTVAYCIIAHRVDEQLLHLIDFLCSDYRSKIYLHVDAKSSFSTTLSGLKYHDKVTLVDRVRVNWGGFSMIRATRNLLTAARSQPSNNSFALLSESCFPLRPMKLLNDHMLDEDADRISLWRIISRPIKTPHCTVEKSIDKRHFLDVEWLNPKNGLIGRLNFKLLSIINAILPYRRYPPMVIAKGSQWFTATKKTIDVFLSNNIGLENFLSFSFAPDETFFQTIYFNHVNSFGADIQWRSQRDNFQASHYIAFHPDTKKFRAMDDQDVTAALASNALFARKCAPQQCFEIVKRLSLVAR